MAKKHFTVLLWWMLMCLKQAAAHNGTVVAGLSRATAPANLAASAPTGVPCSDDPPSEWLPAGGAWICRGARDSCTAFCLDDALQPSSNLTVSCTEFWTAPGVLITCNAPACNTQPEEESEATWRCNLPATNGSRCSAACDGTSNPANPPVAVCDSGDWEYARGSCTEPDFCVEPPPREWLPIGGDWECTTGRDSDTCTAICEAGYDQTGNLTVNGDCYARSWSQPASSITCTPSDCRGTPDPEMQPDATWSCNVPAKHGTECTGGCEDEPSPADPPVAICDFGFWVYMRGSCAGESVKTYYMKMKGPQNYMNIMREKITNGQATNTGNEVLVQNQPAFELYNSELAGLYLSLEGAWVSQSPSSTRRRLLLLQEGLDEIVIGVQLSYGEGIIAKTAEKVVDAVVNSQAAANFMVSQVVDYAKDKAANPALLQQMSLEVTDSVGKPLGASASADKCFVQLVPSTTVNNTAGIISMKETDTTTTVTVCGGARALSTTFDYLASSDVTGMTRLAARIGDSTTTACKVVPAAIAGDANGTTVTVTCRRNAGAFVTAAAYTVVLTANFACAKQQSLAIATTTVNTVVRPRLSVSTSKQQTPICGGKAAAATFRYNFTGLQPNQSFTLTAEVGKNCTTKFASQSPKANGVVTVICTGVHAPGASVPVALNLTATVQGCGEISGSRTARVPVTCCLSGSSYAKVKQATCYRHALPGTTATKCTNPPVNSGYFSRGPGSGKLMLAQKPDSCSDAAAVADITVSCPLGSSGNKVNFTVTHSAAWKPSKRLYMLSCTAPEGLPACPGTPWRSVTAKSGRQGLPEGLATILANGKTTTTFAVTLATCSCDSFYHGMYYFANIYRGLSPNACKA